MVNCQIVLAPTLVLDGGEDAFGSFCGQPRRKSTRFGADRACPQKRHRHLRRLVEWVWRLGFRTEARATAELQRRQRRRRRQRQRQRQALAPTRLPSFRAAVRRYAPVPLRRIRTQTEGGPRRRQGLPSSTPFGRGVPAIAGAFVWSGALAAICKHRRAAVHTKRPEAVPAAVEHETCHIERAAHRLGDGSPSSTRRVTPV